MRKVFLILFMAGFLSMAGLAYNSAGYATSPANRESGSAQNQSKTQAGATASQASAAPAVAPAAEQPQASLPPPTDAEIRTRAEILISNQHHDDLAFLEFERIERQMTRSGGADPHIIEDKTYRVVPTGMGTYKILLKTGDKPVTPAEYRRQLENWVNALQLALNPDDPRAKSITEKFEKKNRDRTELVEAARVAFIPKWLEGATFHGRPCDILELDPNPDFHPRSLSEEAMTHVMAKVWV
ncbi:MAG: hypothetical protein ACREQC_08535, partial [Candidatus Binataceae bacterium]